MRKSSFQINNRRNQIIKKLREHGEIYNKDIGQMLNVSDVTIRRDLEILEKDNQLVRFHGGARLIAQPSNLPVYKEKKNTNIDEKILIAGKAADLIHDNDMVFINSGSTVSYIPKSIHKQNITIITNNVRMPSYTYNENITLCVTGGAHNRLTDSLTGELAKHALEQVYADLCILGVNGISADAGITTSVYQETEINALMLERCQGKRIVVADSDKIGRSLKFISAPITSIDILVTTSKADSRELEKLQACGVEVIQVPINSAFCQAYI